MRRGFGIAGLLVTVILFVIVGAVAYNIGWSDGVNTHLPAATQGDGTPAPYYYGYGFHPFFAGFGILWFLLIFFGIFWLFRMAFWGFAGRRMMGGWGYGKGWGYGPGFGQRRWGSFEERAQEWHKEQHEGKTPPPPPPDTTSV